MVTSPTRTDGTDSCQVQEQFKADNGWGIFIAARTRAHSTPSLSLQTSRLRDHLEEGYVMGEREAEQ